MAKSPIPGWGAPDKPAAEGSRERHPDPASRAAASPDSASKSAAPAAPRAAPAAPPAATEDLLDHMLGDFRILRRLGRGGMAEVYLAEQTQLKRNVAVKVLHKDRVTDASYLKRFKTEAMAAASLSHPNIVQVLLIGEQDGIHYIAQEYVPGMNLREFLARKGPPELALAVRIIRQVALALQAAHAAGIVHRDIKPENIMLTRKGEVKVADFGLAQLTQGGERVNLTQDGVTMGTPLYMSPEQVNGSKVDLRTDIYSLGVTCYHMLSGHPPFRGETAIAVAVQHLKQEPESLEKIRGDLPPLLCRIIHKMMAKDPDMRYQSAQAILKDLKRLTGGAEAHEEHPASEHELKAGQGPTAAGGNFAVRLAARVWHFPDKPVSWQVLIVVALALATGGASAGIGWATRIPNPFAAPLPRDAGVEKKENAASQYFYALNLKDSIEAWQAVIDFKSEDRVQQDAARFFRKYARQQLAMLYLTKRRYDEAQELFNELAELGAAEPQFRAFGLAGQAILLNLRGEYKESQKLLNRLKSPAKPGGGEAPTAPGAGEPRKPRILFDYLDDKMRLAVTETIHRNVENLNQQMSQEWDDIFRKDDAPEAPAVPGNGPDGGK
ncbi:MAG: protein kinase domain-containing protein [Deltaproteobacteria bacterium]